MQVAMLFFNLSTQNGLQRLLLNLAEGMKKHGNDIQIYTYMLEDRFPRTIGNLEIKTKVRYPESKVSSPFVASARQARDYFIAANKWVNMIEKEKFDIIFPFEGVAYKTALSLKKRLGVPVVWYKADAPIFADKGAKLDLYRENMVFRMLVDLFARYDKRVVRQLDKVIVMDGGVKKIIDKYYEIDSEVVWSGGVDVEFFRPRENREEIRGMLEKELLIPADAILILSSSIHMWYRRFEDVIDAVEILGKEGYRIHYLIVGSSKFSPDYTKYLKERVYSKGIQEYVHFVEAFVTEDQLLNFYNACDVFVFPNINQTWGMTPLEVMAVGRPVIVSRGAGVHEALEHGRTAMIINPNDPKGIAASIKELIADESLRKRLSLEGRKFVRENMTWHHCAQRVESSLKKVLDQQIFPR